MKFILTLVFLLLSAGRAISQPVFKNPGIPDHESFTIHEFLDPDIGYVTSRINVALKERGNMKYYQIDVNEGNLFANEIEVKYSDLTTISEKRINLKTNTVVQYYTKTADSVHFYIKEKDIDKKMQTDETNIYSPLAYFFSFRGFPFGIGNSVSFKTYMYIYGGVLTMKLKNTAKQTVTVKAGTFDCYVLELSVGGWQSVFAPDKYYFYFTVAPPHIFVKYNENVDGTWKADELTDYKK